MSNLIVLSLIFKNIYGFFKLFKRILYSYNKYLLLIFGKGSWISKKEPRKINNLFSAYEICFSMRSFGSLFVFWGLPLGLG